MKQFSLFLILACVVVACNKDKFETVPQLKFKSRSGNVIQSNQIFQVVLEYTDKEGDVADSIFVEKERLNVNVPAATIRDSFRLKVPDFPGKDHGEITLNLEYQDHLISANPPRGQLGAPNDREPDTLRIHFVIRDKAGNRSERVSVEPVIVIR